MKVKFELDDMTGVVDLTAGKDYWLLHGNSVLDDSGRKIIIVAPGWGFKCPHLNERAEWEVVK